MNVREFLEQRRVEFGATPHRTTFSAQHLANCLGVPGDYVAKTVVLHVDGRPVLAVLQATHDIDFERARKALAAQSIELAPESELGDLFPDCEFGAVPPFGSEYGLPTIVDEALTHDDYIIFDGNRHTEAISMSYSDFAAIEHPRVATLSRHN